MNKLIANSLLGDKVQPKVSVLVPVFNVELYLEECLQSLIGQTLDDIEIVCVNDGSTDSSLSILRNYALRHKNIVIIDKPNAGYGAALNDGIDAAKGEYFGIVEPDDYVLPDMFQRLYEVAAEHNLDLVKSDHFEFTGKDIGDQSVYVPLTRNKSYYGRVIDPSEDPSVFNLNMVTCTGIYKLDTIRKNGIRYNETPGASYQDNGFWHQSFYFSHRVLFLDEAFYCYRQDNAASSINSRGKALAGRNEYEYIYRILKEHPKEFDTFIGMHTYRKFNNYLYNYQRIQPDAQREFLDTFSHDFREFDSRNEIDWSLFGPRQKYYLKQIMTDPSAYYAKDHGLTIVFAVDNAYAPYAGVAIKSLLNHVNPQINYSVNILYTNLSDQNAIKLLELSKDSVGINLIDVSSFIDGLSIYSTAHFSEAMYYRILIPQLFSDQKKVLYLDCDIILRDDIAKLFHIDLEDAVIGAVRNLCNTKRTEYVTSVLGLNDDEYFNSGVLMFNIDAFLSARIEEKCFELIAEYRNLECPDQDILNLACVGKVKWLPSRWNVAWQHSIEKGQQYRDNRSFQEVINAFEDMAILHFTTGTKPWNTPDEPLAAFFWSVARTTTFYETILLTAARQAAAKDARLRQKEEAARLRQMQAAAAQTASSRKRNLPARARAYYKKNGIRKTIMRVFGFR